MEKIFYVSAKADFPSGIFGTLYECAAFILRSERIPGDGYGTPDADDPIEGLHEQLGFDPDTKYELLPAETAVTRLLTLDEAMNIGVVPEGLQVSDVYDWLENSDFDREALKKMVDALHARKVGVRMRGRVHELSNSPLSDAQYDQLLQQIS